MHSPVSTPRSLCCVSIRPVPTDGDDRLGVSAYRPHLIGGQNIRPLVRVKIVIGFSLQNRPFVEDFIPTHSSRLPHYTYTTQRLHRCRTKQTERAMNDSQDTIIILALLA